MGFKKIQNFPQNPYVLTYGFTENHQFLLKTDRNFVFHGPYPHIPDRWYIIVSYMSFMGFKIFDFVAQNP
jgi:hypothetical protein